MKLSKVQERVLREALDTCIHVMNGLKVRAFISGTMSTVSISTLMALSRKGAITQTGKIYGNWSGKWVVSEEGKKVLSDTSPKAED